MSKIKIKNFGPIKEGYQENDGWMDIKKVTVFIGNQGSGKSTVAKVFSTLTWLEKALYRGDVVKNQLSSEFLFNCFAYQRIQNYFRDDTEIEYEGGAVIIKYNKNLKCPYIVFKNKIKYSAPKIMYVPAERNFLSVIKNAYGVKNIPGALYTFAEELLKGQRSLNSKLLSLPIGDVKYKFKKENETSYIIGKDFEIDITESSSGFQSFVPLFLVTKFLTDDFLNGRKPIRENLSVEQNLRRKNEIEEILNNENLTVIEKSKRESLIEEKYINRFFINIVEEPEQNLFPSSQRLLLNSLLEFNNGDIYNNANKLVITTHSPYLINYLTLAVKAYKVCSANLNEDQLDKVNKIVPLNSIIKSEDLVIYELDEKQGLIKKLDNYEGIPSDANYLNLSIREGNQLYDALLDIEEEL